MLYKASSKSMLDGSTGNTSINAIGARVQNHWPRNNDRNATIISHCASGEKWRMRRCIYSTERDM